MRLLSAAGLRVLTARAPGAGFHHADLRIDNVMEVDGVTGCARGAERPPRAPPPPLCARAARAHPCRGVAGPAGRAPARASARRGLQPAGGSREAAAAPGRAGRGRAADERLCRAALTAVRARARLNRFRIIDFGLADFSVRAPARPAPALTLTLS